MGYIEINPNIFPHVMSLSIGNPGSHEFQTISLPAGANLLYLQTMNNPDEISLLKKYANMEEFSDSEYKELFELFINNIPRLSPPSGSIENCLEQFGVQMDKKDDKFQFSLINDYIPQIRTDTWEYIAISMLSPAYTDIINCFDFGNINIYLGSWKTKSDLQSQSLLTAFRNAFMFTLVGYLYGDDCNLYPSFREYFDIEYYKRISLIYGTWKHREDGKAISYIPIFDSFYNLKGVAPNTLIQILQQILEDTDIVKDERDVIRNRLVEGAEKIHSDNTPEQQALEEAVIKPVINFIMELQSANDNLIAAITLNKEMLSEPSINRSYYSMMHALKALLENKRKLSDWEPDKLNVSENHWRLEKKLEELCNENVISNGFYSDFKYVKQKRWIADYNVSKLNSAESEECILRATSFLEEVKNITKGNLVR